MVDEIYDRHYQAARSDLNAALLRASSRFAHAIRNAFEVLNRIEYQTPWSGGARRVRYN